MSAAATSLMDAMQQEERRRLDVPRGTELLRLEHASKYFGSVVALEDVSIDLKAGEVHALLGDNGAGKSTLIKILSGVHQPDKGRYLVEGQEVHFTSPRDALARGIATVYQDLAMIPLMSISRNFFLGAEPTTGWGPFRRFDVETADRISREELLRMGINVRDTAQAVGTLSGGERQSVAIARAVYFGARVLILDEPTAALGVKEAAVVLRYIAQARARNLGVIFITHNVHHAYPVADRFTILNRGLIELKRGQFARAIAQYDAALAIDARRARAYYGRGVAKLKITALTLARAPSRKPVVGMPVPLTFVTSGRHCKEWRSIWPDDVPKWATGHPMPKSIRTILGGSKSPQGATSAPFNAITKGSCGPTTRRAK